MTEERGSAFWQSTLDGIETRMTAARETLRKLRDRKAALALDAQMGVGQAAKELSGIDRESNELRNSIEQMELATTTATEKLRAAQAAEQDAADLAQRAKCREIAGRAITVAGEVDAAFQALVSAADRFKSELTSLVQESQDERLGRSALFDTGLWNRAARGHGLTRHMELPSRMAPMHEEPFSEVATGHLDRWLVTE